MPYYQAAHDTTGSPTVVGNGQTNSIFTSLSSLPAAAGGAGAGVSDFDDQPTILHQNEDASSRYRRWWVRVAAGVAMVSCLVVAIALAMSNTTTGGRSASLRGGTPGPAAVAAATMATEGYVLQLHLEDMWFVFWLRRACGRDLSDLSVCASSPVSHHAPHPSTPTRSSPQGAAAAADTGTEPQDSCASHWPRLRDGHRPCSLR